MKKVKPKNSQFVSGNKDGDIPEWLLTEVLIRLPVKLVLRLKLVSKRWLSIISHPSFSRVYVCRASSFAHLQRWTFISQYMHVHNSHISNELLVDIYSRDLEDPSVYALPFPGNQQQQEMMKYKIFGVSSGLMLYGPITLSHREGSCLAAYSIWNPATRQRIALPSQSSCFDHLTREVITGFITQVESNILMTYRVVCLHLTGETKTVHLDVFISEIGEWKEFSIPMDHAIRIELYKAPPILNGVLHWMTREHGLLTYDPYRAPDCLSFIALPKDPNPRFDDIRAIPSICNEHEGRLRYFEVFHKDTPPMGFSGIRVWTLNDYKSRDWSLLHSVKFSDISCDGIFFDQELEPTPLSFHPFDGNILYLGYISAILSYNLKNRKMEAHGDPSFAALVNKMVNGWDPAWWWTLLFVIPPWPVSITSPNIEQ